VVAGGKIKQDVIIADATSTAPLTLWEADVDCLIEGNTTPSLICWSGHFKGKKQLSAYKTCSSSSCFHIIYGLPHLQSKS